MKEKYLGGMSHYSSHYVMLAGCKLEQGKKKEADNLRTILIDKLENSPPEEKIKECIKLVKESNWSTIQGLKEYSIKYKKLK